ncbi:UNVERIFIED_CONTAM: hypothetical protein QO022_43195, partial [Pseudomonas aeruginosa]
HPLPGNRPAGTVFRHSSRKTMKSKRAAFADDLRKIGTTAVAASLVGIFLSEHRLLTAYAFVMGMVIWLIGIALTEEE